MKQLLYWCVVVVAIGALLAPAASFALPFPYWATDPPLLPCVGSSCRNLCQLVDLSHRVIWFGLSLTVFALAPIFITWGGLMMIVSGGSEDRVKSGRRIVTAAVTGLAIALGSFFIVNQFLVWLGGGASTWSTISC